MKKKRWIFAALFAMLFLLGVGNLYPVYASAQTYKYTYTIRVPKGAGLHVYKSELAYAEMKGQTVSEPVTEGDYDVYTSETDAGTIACVTGGEGTEFKRTAALFYASSNNFNRTIDAVRKGEESPGRTEKNNDLYTNAKDSFVEAVKGADNVSRASFQAYRVAQTTRTTTTSEFIEPEMKVEMIYQEADKGECYLNRKGGLGRYEYAVQIGRRGATSGLAVFKITYDEMDKDGIHYPAIDDANTGIVFVQLGGTPEDIKPTMTQYDRGTKGQSAIRNDFDTVYFLGTTTLSGKEKEPVPGEGSTKYTFNAGKGTQVFVHDPVKASDTTFDNTNTAWTEYTVDTEGNCKVTLKNGRNPIKITKEKSVFYTVINAKEVDVTVENRTHPGQEIAARDKVGVSFEGLELPVYKMACIYNPGWKQRGDQTWAEYTLNGKDTVDSAHIQYNIDTANTIEFKAAKGENTLSQGQIHCAHMGSGLYAHTEIPSEGLNQNFNAGTGGNSQWFNILPDITFTARALTEEEEKDADVREVEELIDKVEALRDGDDFRYAIKELLDALDAYEDLDGEQKDRVTNASVLMEAYYERDAADVVRRVVDLSREIQALPENAAKENAEAIQSTQKKLNELEAEDAPSIPQTYRDKLNGLVEGLDGILANEVIDKITDLDSVTAENCLEKREAIGQAREAYEALSENAKAKVTNRSALEAAEALLREADLEMAAVEDAIEAIGEVKADNWKDKQEAIGQARAAYDALSKESKERVKNLKALTDAEAVVSAGQAEEVIAQIEAIGDVTADNWAQKQTAVSQAHAAYGALPESAQELVSNLESLKAAEAAIQSREAAVNDAINKINAIGEVTADNWKEKKEAIAQARAAYSALSENEKSQITGAEALTAAEAIVDQEEAKEAIALIEDIGEVTVENMNEKRTAVGQARTAYDALSENAKKLVTNLADLEAAEAFIQTVGAETPTPGPTITPTPGPTITETPTPGPTITETPTPGPVITAVMDVIAKIEAIGEVTADNWKEKDAAEAFIQTGVVDPVKAKIDQIGTLSETNCKQKEPLVKEARDMYNELTDRLKAMIGNYAVLENAEGFLREYNSVNQEMKAFQESAAQGLKAKAVSCTAVELSWKPLKDADGYRVYRRASGGAWSQIAEVSGCVYKDGKVAVGKAYAYKVAGVSKKWGGEAVSKDSAIANCTLKLGKATLVSVKSKDYQTLKLAWKKVTGASGYTVYRAAKKNGEYKAIAQVKKGDAVTYENAKCATGVAYYYKVRAYRTVNGETGYGEYSGVKSGKASLTAPKATVKKGKRSATVQWSGVKGANGYQVYRADKKGGGFKKIADVKKKSYANKGLKSKKTYYYKVRAYRMAGKKKVYGSFSAVKAVKAK